MGNLAIIVANTAGNAAGKVVEKAAEKTAEKAAEKVSEYSIPFVCGMGLGTVFVGLICIIIICTIMGALCKALIKEKPATATASSEPANTNIANKQEIIAACCAVIAEELGEDANNIRVKSFKQI